MTGKNRTKNQKNIQQPKKMMGNIPKNKNNPNKDLKIRNLEKRRNKRKLVVEIVSIKETAEIKNLENNKEDRIMKERKVTLERENTKRKKLINIEQIKIGKKAKKINHTLLRE